MHEDALAIVRSALAERYEVEKEIGRGGMALVWRARDLRHDRDVAIKLLYPELARAVGGDRFLREIRILAKLSHPHILPLLDSGTVEIMPGLQVPWYVMPFVAEETLRVKLTREGPLPVPVALRYTRELCSALTHAHAHGYIHRDIKPENILLRGDQAVLADFGIARAVTVASGTALSSTGLVVGTPAYMSPEQSLGSDKLDARSDIYSLGVVLYEMLAGHPPFSGATPQAISARHQFETPPPIGVVRPGLPSGVEAVVTKALAKVPADRYGTAGELDTEIDRAFDPVASPSTRAKTRRWGLTAGAIAGLAVTAWLVLPRYFAGQKYDSARYVILPFLQHDTIATALITSRNCEQLISDILGRLPDHSLVSSLTVGSTLATTGDPVTTKAAIAIARGFGAGRLVWGEVTAFADTVRVTGVLYDASNGRELRNKTIRLPAAELTIGGLATRFTELTYALVLPGQPTPETASDVLGAKSFAAWRVYATGDSALNEWNLPLAKAKYREALTLDPEYPNANLKLAQVGAWLDDPVGEWRPYAERAVAAQERLSATNQLMGTGLVSLADREYPEACALYRAMLARDSLDFRGWFGLGECLTQDNIVVPDSTSPSRWKFRTSYAAGIAAYSRGLTLVPSSHLAYSGAALRRLAVRLMTEPDMLRLGQTEGDAPAYFAAFPSLRTDTLAFTPYPSTDAVAGTQLPATWPAALEQNRRTLLSITSVWLARFPRSRAAILTHAEALEMLGRLDDQGQTASALDLIRDMRTSAPGDLDLDLAVRAVRLLIKTTRYTAARMIAESALAVPPQSAEEGIAQAGLAALIGRIGRAADLSAEYGVTQFASPTGELVEVLGVLASDANRLLVYASFGEPAESIGVIALRIRNRVAQTARPGQRQRLLESLLFQSRLLGYPLLSEPPRGEFPIALAESRLLHGDRAGARAALGRLNALRPRKLEPSIAPDFGLLEARLWALAGDTVEARRRVSVMLMSPSALSTEFLGQVSQAAAIGRAMTFCRSVGCEAQGPGLDSALTALWKDSAR